MINAVIPSYSFTKSPPLDQSGLENSIRDDVTFQEYLADSNSVFLFSKYESSTITFYFDNEIDAQAQSRLADDVANYVSATTITEVQIFQIDPNANSVRVRKEINSTNEAFRITALKFVTDGSTDRQSFVYSFPYDINILSVIYEPDSSIKNNDIIGFTITATIGTITQDVSINDTIINVSQTVVDNLFAGRYLILNDGTNISDLGKVVAVDKTAHTVTVLTGSNHSYSVSTPTYVILDTVFAETFHADGTFIKGIELETQAKYDVGAVTFQASFVPKDPAITIDFTPIDAGVRTGKIRVQHFY